MVTVMFENGLPVWYCRLLRGYMQSSLNWKWEYIKKRRPVDYIRVFENRSIKLYSCAFMDRSKVSLRMVMSNKSEWSKFLCSLCHHLPRDAVQTKCGHLLCFECVQQLLSEPESRCPEDNCAQPLRENGRPCHFPDLYVRGKTAPIPVACVNDTNGCAWTGTVKEFQAHFDSCQYADAKPSSAAQIQS